MTWRDRLRRRRDQRGAVIVEAALVLPIVMLVLFGMLEMGLYWKDSLTLSEAAKDAPTPTPSGERHHRRLLRGAGDQKRRGQYQRIRHRGHHLQRRPDRVDEQLTVTAPSAACLASLNGGGDGVTVNDGSGNPGAIGSCNIYYPSDFNRPVTDWSGAAQGSVVFPASRTGRARRVTSRPPSSARTA